MQPPSKDAFDNGLIFGLLGIPGAILFIASIFNQNPWCFFGGLAMIGLWQLLGGKAEA
jgi:hypothetical protein